MTIETQALDLFKIYKNHFIDELTSATTKGQEWHYHETLEAIRYAECYFKLAWNQCKKTEPLKALTMLVGYIGDKIAECNDKIIEQMSKNNIGTAKHYQRLIKTYTALADRVEHIKGGFFNDFERN